MRADYSAALGAISFGHFSRRRAGESDIIAQVLQQVTFQTRHGPRGLSPVSEICTCDRRNPQ